MRRFDFLMRFPTLWDDKSPLDQTQKRRNLMHPNCSRALKTAQVDEDLTDIESMMVRHEGLVHAFIQRQGGGDIPYEEALQAGRIGLWRAIRGYDPTRGTTFSTYAWVIICRHINRRAKELNQSADVWLQEPPASWVLPDPAGVLEEELARSALLDLISQLPERLRRVIVSRYGLGEASPSLLKELGKEMGLTRERVRQLQQEALAWLRHPAHSWRLRQLVDRNTAADYRRALAQNAALRRSRRRER
jgi:RNA polymerase sigma factor (sigma-70 family)